MRSGDGAASSTLRGPVNERASLRSRSARPITGRSAGALVFASLWSCLAACSGETTTNGEWQPRSVSTLPSSTLSGQIIEVWVLPYPEGSNYVSYRSPAATDATAKNSGAKFDAFVAAIGWPLPDAIEQPRRCQRGVKNFTVAIVLDSGQRQPYGPCVLPAIADRAVAELGTGYP